MMILKDKLNWHDVLASTRTDSWKKRREGESAVECLNRISIPSTVAFDKLEWRESNKYLLDSSFKISFAVLSFLRKNKMEKSTLEELLGFELDLRGSYDWSLSQIKKIELYTNLKILL